MAGAYETAFRRSLDERETFWAEAAADLHWYKRRRKSWKRSPRPPGAGSWTA